MKKLGTRCVAPILILSFAASFCSIGIASAEEVNQKLDPELAEVLKKTDAAARVPVFVLFSRQASGATLESSFPGLAKQERRTQTVAWLKKLTESTSREFETWIQKNQLAPDIEPARKFWLVNGAEAKCTGRAIQLMSSWGGVSRIYLRTEKPADFVKRDPKWARLSISQPRPVQGWKGLFLSEGKELSWNLKIIGADQVWKQGFTGRGVTVAILDSGMNFNHPDIKNNLWINRGEIPENGQDDDQNGYIDDFLGWNFAEENQNITDDFFHGTIVGGLVAGDGTGGIITGVAPQADLMILKTYAYDRTKKYGSRFLWQAFQYDKWLALQYAVENGAQVTSLSFDYQPSEKPLFAPWRYVLANATYCGLSVVAGAGNSRSWLKDPNQITPPANVPEVIAVGATAEDDHIDRVSSRGPVTWQNVPPFCDFPLPAGLIKPDLCAPIGRCPYISFSSNGYDYLSGEGGTSSSGPHVAGVIALMLEKNPELLPAEIKKRLEETSLEAGAPGKDNYYGWGRVAALEAVNYGSRPNIRLMGWRFNNGQALALLPGQKLDILLEFLVTSCPVSEVAILLDSLEPDVRLVDRAKHLVFPKPIEDNQIFRMKAQGLVAAEGLAGKKLILKLFLNADQGRKFHYELPLFIGPSEILVVDDDGEGQNEEPVLEGLDDAHRYYHCLATRKSELDGELISRYKHLIWITGEEFRNTLDAHEQRLLKDFLERGGHLLLLGDNIGDDIGNSDFYKDYLKAKVIKETLTGNYAKVEYRVFGRDGDPVSRRMIIPTFVNYKQYDLIRPLAGADDPFTAADEKTYLGFVRYQGRYKLFYTSLGLEAIESRPLRAMLLDRILEWFEQ